MLLYRLLEILTEKNSCRAEFGGILFYFYVCDRTDIFSDSTKVPLSFPVILDFLLVFITISSLIAFMFVLSKFKLK